jgi:hypothetical protein
LLAIPVLVLGLLACAPNPDQGPLNKENRLLAAGFKKRSIRTEAQLADFRSIPAHMVRRSSYKGRTVYVYADPTICGCLYMGGTAAYNAYISDATIRQAQQEYRSDTTDDGYSPTPAMLDGGPWDDAEMYGLYIN